MGRKESIIGKTYFNSKQLLNTEIDDIKPFIADFTLPETGLEVTGSSEEIREQFEQHSAANTTYSELVIKWHLKDVGGFYQNRWFSFDGFSNKLSAVRELWLLINDRELGATKYFGNIMLNLTAASVPLLEKLHVIVLGLPVTAFFGSVPKDFDQIAMRLKLYHVEGLQLSKAKSDDFRATAACLETGSAEYSSCVEAFFSDVTDDEASDMRSLALQNLDRSYAPIEWTLFRRANIFRNLRFLQITGKVIQQFPVDVHTSFPLLQVLDVS